MRMVRGVPAEYQGMELQRSFQDEERQEKEGITCIMIFILFFICARIQVR